MSKALKRVLQVVGIVIAALLVLVIGYVAYLTFSYSRIADNTALEIENNQTAQVQTGVEYAALTYNIGFGAYSPDYTFFMDEGIMKDGTETVGTSGTAASEAEVQKNTAGAIEVAQDQDADFLLLQEVDTDSTRSYHVNQKEAIAEAFPTMSSAFAVNFHSAFLPYPLYDMHGTVNAGTDTLAAFEAESATRRSYPITEEWPTKFFDLDRCFTVERFDVEGGKQLVLINSHMSAYDEGGTIRAQQLEMLRNVLAEEAEEGNYVIAGGDWNHALCGSVDIYESDQQIPEWVSVLTDDDLPEGFHVVRADNLEEVPTCRGDDIPYEEGVTYTTTVDGFIVSSNVQASAENVDTDFAYSDHNPVKLTFTLTK